MYCPVSPAAVFLLARERWRALLWVAVAAALYWLDGVSCLQRAFTTTRRVFSLRTLRHFLAAPFAPRYVCCLCASYATVNERSG